MMRLVRATSVRKTRLPPAALTRHRSYCSGADGADRIAGANSTQIISATGSNRWALKIMGWLAGKQKGKRVRKGAARGYCQRSGADDCRHPRYLSGNRCGLGWRWSLSMKRSTALASTSGWHCGRKGQQQGFHRIRLIMTAAFTRTTAMTAYADLDNTPALADFAGRTLSLPLRFRIPVAMKS